MIRALFIGFILCCTTTAFAELWDADQALLDRDYARAATLYAARNQGTGPAAERALLGLGMALRLAGRPADALQAFEKLLAIRPPGPFSPRASFLRAEALGSLSRWEEAAASWEKEAMRLLAPSRKEDLAQGYVQLAEKAQTPADKNTAADPARAVNAYTKALEIGLSPKAAWKARLSRAQAQLAAGQTQAAREELEALAKDTSGLGPMDELYITLARALLAAGDVRAARMHLRSIAARVPSTAQTAEALLELAKSYGLPNPGSDADLERGTEALKALFACCATTEQAKSGALLLASSLVSRGRHDEAIVRLKEFITAHQNSSEGTLLAQARLALARSYRAQKRFDEALAAFGAYLSAHPFHEESVAAQREVVDAQYESAQDLAQKRQFAESHKALTAFLARYPLDGRGPDCLLEMARLTREQEDVLGAIEAYRRVVTKYPNSEAASRAQFEIAASFEARLKDPKKALEEYARLTWGSFAPKAAEAKAMLERRELTITPERVFRTTEKPHLLVKTRNLKALTLKIYRVDPASYFSRKSQLGGLDSLDVDLIQPDQVLEFPLKDAPDFVETEHTIELPLKGPGLWAVQAGEEEIWAAVGVQISDVELLVKAAKGNAFVMTWNATTQTPLPGVDVTISDGARLLKTGKTGENGVLSLEEADLTDPAHLVVLALHDGSCASTGLVPQSASATSLSPRGYIYTDRPAYQPGQEVHLKGILRTVDKQAYTFTPGETLVASVRYPSGRVLSEVPVHLSDHGTVVHDVKLPASAPEGTYSVQVGRRGHTPFTGSFQVANYNLPSLLLSVESKGSVLAENEPLKAKIRSTRPDGSPVPQVAVQYRIPGVEETHTGITGHGGELEIELDTRDMENGSHVLSVTAVPDGVNAELSFTIAGVGVKPEISLSRDLVLSREAFTARLKVADLGGKPVTGPVTIDAIREVSRPGEPTAEVVEKSLTATLDAAGEAAVSLELAIGGPHLVRLWAKDAAGHRAAANARVNVTAPDDPVRLRILTDDGAGAAATYRAGDSASFRVVSWLPDRLALVTMEAGRVLDYRLVPLKTGDNRIEWEMKEAYSPNATFAVAVVDTTARTGRLHSASRDITVSHGLSLSVSPDKAVAQPGGEVKLTVKTTDHRGKPVDAEVSVAVVDEALLSLFPDPAGSLVEVFQQRRAATALSVASSAGTTYAGVTRTLSEDLLAEEHKAQRVTLRYDAPTPIGKILREIAAKSGFTVLVPSDLESRTTTVNLQDTNPEDALFTVVSGSGFRPQKTRERNRTVFSFVPDAMAAVPVPAPALLPPASGAGGGGAVTEDDAAPPPPEAPMENKRAEEPEVELEEGVVTKSAPATTRPSKKAKVGRYGARLNRALLGKAFAKDSDEAGSRGSTPVARREFPETAFYVPALRTGTAGETIATFRLPGSLTRYRILARAVTRTTRVGEATGSLTAAKSLSVDLLVPQYLVEGDEAGVIAVLRGQVTMPTKVQLSLTGTNLEAQQLDAMLEPGQETRVPLRIKVGTPGECALKLEVKSATDGDALEKTLSVRSRQLFHYDSSGGLLTETAAFRLRLPYPGLNSRELRLTFSPGLPATLTELLANEPADTQGVVDTLRRQLAYLGTLRVISAQPGQREMTRERCRVLLGQLLGEPPPQSALQAADRLEVLTRARHEGLAVSDEIAQEALNAARNQYGGADDSGKRWLLYAMAGADGAELSQMARFMRGHQPASLDTGLVALGLYRMGRKEAAANLARVFLREDVTPEMSPPDGNRRGNVWGRGRRHPATNAYDLAEDQAFRLQALVLCQPDEKAVQRSLNTLLSLRDENGFPSSRSAAAAAEAISVYLAYHVPESRNFRLRYKVGNAAEVEIASADLKEPRTIVVPEKDLPDGEVPVSLSLSGRGDVDYRAVLSGLGPVLQMPNHHQVFQVQRRLSRASLMHNGKDVPRGSGCVQGSYTAPVNPVTQVALGETIQVEVDIGAPRSTSPEEILVEEPIPAGCALLPGSLTGTYRYARLEGGRIVAAFPAGRNLFAHLNYRISGRLPGLYLMLPVRVVSRGQPRRYAYSASRTLEVLDALKTPSDSFQLSPDELYHLGKMAFDDLDKEKAWEHLNALKNYQLTDNAARETSRILLLLAIEKKDAAAVLRHSETLKEKYRDLSLPFDTVLKIGHAHQQMHEYEVAASVFRGIAEASFLLEAQLAGEWQQAGDLLRAANYTRSLIAEYPNLSVVQTAHMGLAHLVLEKGGKSDAVLQHLGRDLLEEFLIQNPDSPMADEATFALSEACLDSGRPELARVIAAAGERRYPKSRLKDGFLYIQGWAQFEKGEHEAALKLLEPVAQDVFPDSEGQASESRPLALYLIGQIHQTVGRIREALVAYHKIADQFVDAAETIAELEHKELTCPEVTRVEPGQAVRLPVVMRNMGQADVKAYRVDLMRLYLRERSLAGITRVNLAGIHPLFEASLSVPAGASTTPHSQTLALPFHEEGAYLVVLKGEEVSTCGLVLVSRLTLAVNEDASCGRVRVHVQKGPKDAPVYGANVKVVGSESPGLSSGRTDPRGLYTADSISGVTTVMARLGESFAFYRGTKPLAVPVAQNQSPVQAQTRSTEDLKGQVLSGIKRRARALGQQRSDYLEQNIFHNDARGVQIKQMF